MAFEIPSLLKASFWAAESVSVHDGCREEEIDSCLCRKEPKMKSGFTTVDTNCDATQVLVVAVWEKGGF